MFLRFLFLVCSLEISSQAVKTLRFLAGRRVPERKSHLLAVGRPSLNWRGLLLHWCHSGVCQVVVHIPNLTGKNRFSIFMKESAFYESRTENVER